VRRTERDMRCFPFNDTSHHS